MHCSQIDLANKALCGIPMLVLMPMKMSQWSCRNCNASFEADCRSQLSHISLRWVVGCAWLCANAIVSLVFSHPALGARPRAYLTANAVQSIELIEQERYPSFIPLPTDVRHTRTALLRSWRYHCCPHTVPYRSRCSFTNTRRITDMHMSRQ